MGIPLVKADKDMMPPDPGKPPAPKGREPGWVTIVVVIAILAVLALYAAGVL